MSNKSKQKQNIQISNICQKFCLIVNGRHRECKNKITHPVPSTQRKRQLFLTGKTKLRVPIAEKTAVSSPTEAIKMLKLTFKYEGDPRSNSNTSVISSTFGISKNGLHVYYDILSIL